jgi:hypothetical protein
MDSIQSTAIVNNQSVTDATTIKLFCSQLSPPPDRQIDLPFSFPLNHHHHLLYSAASYIPRVSLVPVRAKKPRCPDAISAYRLTYADEIKPLHFKFRHVIKSNLSLLESLLSIVRRMFKSAVNFRYRVGTFVKIVP